MNDINSLPTVPQHMVEAMKREADKKFGAQPQEEAQTTHINPALQHYEEPVLYTEPEVYTNEEPTPEPQDTVQELPVPAQAKETDQARNFRAIKEKAKQAERERDEAFKIIRELQTQTKQQAPIPQAQPEQYDFSVNPDDLVEGKHLNQYGKELKNLQNELKNYKQQSYVENSKARLKSQFPDFESVVNNDTIETFQYAYPELAATLNSTSDVYTAGVSAYHMIKKFGVYTDPESTPEKELAKKNMAKPRPLTSVSPQQGDSPMSRANAFANGLTKELKDQLAREMKEARRGY